jgi:uncharacterized membrane protein SpoIIM required for sporulation
MVKKKRANLQSNFNLKKEYINSWKFIKESKYFIWSIIFIFFAFSFIGYFFPVSDSFSDSILKFLEELIKKTEGMSPGQLILFIFFNNIQSSFMGLVLGVFLGFFSILFALFNGYILGFVAVRSVDIGGPFILLQLLPHGIFELPAIFLSLGLGLQLGLWLIFEPLKYYWKKNKLISFLFLLFYLPAMIVSLYSDKVFRNKIKKAFEIFSTNFEKSLKVFILIILPLLILAAIIEGLLISLF